VDVDVPEHCQGNVDEKVCTAACDEEDTNRRDCVDVRFRGESCATGICSLKIVIRIRPIFLRAPIFVCSDIVNKCL
jgi:hypothetical protein